MRADRTRDKTSRRELIHTSMRLTDEMRDHYAVGRTVLATKAVTRYNRVVKILTNSSKVLDSNAAI